MNIYCAHSSAFDYRKYFYGPIVASTLTAEHNFIFSHQNNIKPVSSKSIFSQHQCDLLLAEVSAPSTGLGIEIGWASANNIPVMAVHLESVVPSSSIGLAVDKLISYKDGDDLVNKIRKEIRKHETKS